MAMYCKSLPVKDIKKALRMNTPLPLMLDIIAMYSRFTEEAYVNLEDFTGNCDFFSFVEFICEYCTSLCHVFVNNTSYTYIISAQNGDSLYINNRLSKKKDDEINEIVCNLIKDCDDTTFYHNSYFNFKHIHEG
jgi:hypothetical protein